MTQPPEPPQTDYQPGAMPASSLTGDKAVWYRRPWVIVTVVVVIMVGASVLSDLPHHISTAEDAAAQNASIKQINNDLAPCNYAVSEAYRFYRMEQQGKITASDAKILPKQLNDDQVACSFASGPVYDLTNNFQALDTKAGTYIDDMHTVIVTWVSSDALAAIQAITALLTKTPNNAGQIKILRHRTGLLNSERLQALNDWQQACNILGVQLNPVKIAKLPTLV